jgi:hypothetical protein
MLQFSLSQVAKPWYALRSLRIFRDEVNLAATPSIWSAITSVVDNSKYVIYLASPESASSPWVERELAYWIQSRSIEQLLIVLTGGTIEWSDRDNDFDWERTTALSPVLRGHFNEEPLYIDLRWVGSSKVASRRFANQDTRFRHAMIKLAARIQGVSAEEIIDREERQRRRKRRLVAAAVGCFVILLLSLILLGFYRASIVGRLH